MKINLISFQYKILTSGSELKIKFPENIRLWRINAISHSFKELMVLTFPTKNNFGFGTNSTRKNTSFSGFCWSHCLMDRQKIIMAIHITFRIFFSYMIACQLWLHLVLFSFHNNLFCSTTCGDHSFTFRPRPTFV